MEPKIRFKGFSGVWKETTISETGKCISGIGFPEQEQGGRTGIPFYKVSDMNNVGNEKVMTVSNNYVSLEQVKKNGWKVITDVPAIYFAKVGAAVLLNRKRLVLTPCLCDNNTMLFSFDKVKWDSFFCYSYFETLDLSSLVQVGSLPSYNNNIVGKINILQPVPKEQKAIGLYFKYLDDLIQSTIKKIESLKQVKAASLQSMFPQEGETKPSVRFKGFEGDWEKTIVGNLGATYSGLSGKTKDDFGQGDAKFVTFLNVLTNAKIDTSTLEPVKVSKGEHQNEVKKGDLLFNTSSETPEEVGMCAVMDDELENVYLNSFCFGFRITDKDIDPTFIAYLMRSHIGRRIMLILAQGATRYNLSKNNFCKTELLLPESKAEQAAIGRYFSNLDKQITLQAQRLEKLKQIKSACLDNMFV